MYVYIYESVNKLNFAYITYYTTVSPQNVLQKRPKTELPQADEHACIDAGH